MATKLFVGNLPFSATENDLQDYFATAGTVIAVNIMQDRATGRSRGFAFIEMGSQAEADAAISQFHGKEFQGRPLTVNEARPREDQTARWRRWWRGLRRWRRRPWRWWWRSSGWRWWWRWRWLPRSALSPANQFSRPPSNNRRWFFIAQICRDSECPRHQARA